VWQAELRRVRVVLDRLRECADNDGNPAVLTERKDKKITRKLKAGF
jgi:hypothetical protein